MIVNDLITDEIPPLKYTDTVDLALNWMEEFKVNHLAVINGCKKHTSNIAKARQ